MEDFTFKDMKFTQIIPNHAEKMWLSHSSGSPAAEDFSSVLSSPFRHVAESIHFGYFSWSR